MKFLKMSHLLTEMAMVGNVGSCEISVFSKEGSVAHFHFYDKQGGKKGCIKISSPEYFVHGNYKDKLVREDVKELVEWLNSKYEGSTNFSGTYFDMIVMLWNMNNPEHTISAPATIPNYLELK